MNAFEYKGILEFTGHDEVAMIEGDNPLDIIDELRKIQKSLCEYKGLDSYILIVSNKKGTPLIVWSENANNHLIVLDINPIFREKYDEFYTKKNGPNMEVGTLGF